MLVDMENKNKKLQIRSNNCIDILGDLEVLLLLIEQTEFVYKKFSSRIRKLLPRDQVNKLLAILTPQMMEELRTTES